MSRIKSKDTSLDLTMKKILIESNFDYVMYPNIFGHPDFLVGRNTVIFCDGSFWHGRDWKKLKKKLGNGNNPEYWVNHIKKNRNRDKIVTKKLIGDGYAVLRLWDDEILKHPNLCVNKIKKQLN